MGDTTLADQVPWAALAGLALATSTLSAVVGLAGGILLLAVLLLFFDPLVAIPLHGVVQLASNASRAYLQRAYIEGALVARFAWLLLPAGFLGIGLAQRISPEAGRLGIGFFVLLATWAPSALRTPPPPKPGAAQRRFLAAGGLVGFAGMLVGATGPVVAPFVLSLPLSRQGVIGTLAACQTLGHLAKIAIFGAIGFSFQAYALPLSALCLGALAGSWLGSRLLDYLDERLFRHLIRLVLTALALHLVGRGLF